MDFSSTYDSEAKIWSGSRTIPTFNRDCSVGQVALLMMRSKPAGAVCQISDDESTTLTYETATLYAVRIAQALAEIGVTQDDIVGLVTPNSTYQMPIIVGCWLNGTAFHGVNGVLEQHVIKHCFNITKPKVIFCAAESYKKVKSATAGWDVKFYIMRNSVEGVPNIEELLEPTATELFYKPAPLKYGPKQTMAIMCSSGTTGLPKAVKVSNDILVSGTLIFNGSNTLFTFSTSDWGSGLFCILFHVTVGGTRIVTARPYTPEYMLDIIYRHKVSVLFMLPTQCFSLTLLPDFTEERLKSIKFVFCGGGPASPTMLENFRAKVPGGLIMNGYGSSEAGGIACNFMSYKLPSVGNVLGNTQVKIVDPETKQALGPNQVGEIVVLNENSWTGYYNDAEATSKMQDEEGWVRTGDLGYVDEENFLFIVGRNRDVIKYKGMHYTPKEIEDIISACTDVEDVCVFGVYSDECGDSAAAAVVKRNASNLTEEKLIKYVAEKQPDSPYKHLHAGVYFVKEIFRNANGKVLRNKVKESCLKGKTSHL